MGRPSSDNARDTRREILDTALDLFAERGYHGTSVREIATAVGVRESALYHHFPSKEAVLTAVLADHAEARIHEVEPALRALVEQPLEEIVTVLVQQVLRIFQSDRHRKIIRVVLG